MFEVGGSPRRRGLQEIEGLLRDVRPARVRHDEARFRAALAQLVERFDELAPGAARDPETLLESVAPVEVLHEEGVFRKNRDFLAGRFDELAAKGGRIEALGAARPARTRARVVFQAGLATGLALLLGLGLFVALSMRGGRTRVAVKHPPAHPAARTHEAAARLLRALEQTESSVSAAARRAAPAGRRGAPEPDGESAAEKAAEPLGPRGERNAAPQQQEPPGVNLAYYTLTGSGISLSWSFTAGAGASWDGVVVLRAPSGVEPTYPADCISQEQSGTSFVDSTVVGGRSYCYRVVVVKNGAPVAYSGVLRATASSSVDLSLVSEVRGSHALLGWSVSFGGLAPQITGYTVYKSSSGSDFSGAASFNLPTSARSFTDDAFPGPFYYQVVALDGARVLATSNTVCVSPSDR